MEDRGPELRAVIVVFLFFTWLGVGLRCWVRLRFIRNFGVDDWLLFITQIFFSIFCAFVLSGVHWGTGRHLKDLTEEQILNATKTWLFGELFYIICTSTMRLAVGAFILQVTIQRSHRLVIHVSNFINICFNTYFFLITLFQCRPISHFWNQYRLRPLEGMDGECQSDLAIKSTYVQSGVSAALDYTFAILPVFIIWDLHMDMRKKMAVLVVLGLAGLASTATIVRIPYIVTFFRNIDFLWTTTPVAIWSSVEPGIGITALSLAALRPLLRHIGAKLGMSSVSNGCNAPPSYNDFTTTPQRRNNLAYGLNYWHDEEDDAGGPGRFQMGNTTRIEGGPGVSRSGTMLEKNKPRGETVWQGSRESEEDFVIMKTLDVVTYRANEVSSTGGLRVGEPESLNEWDVICGNGKTKDVRC